MILNKIGKWADAYPNCPGFLGIFCNELIVKFSSLFEQFLVRNECHVTKHHQAAEEKIYLKNKSLFLLFPCLFQETFHGLSSAILSGDVSVK